LTSPQDLDVETGAPDRACATCGHSGHEHLVREVEVPGNTVRETYCSACAALCEFVPEQDIR
jgi:hypothetical protein